MSVQAISAAFAVQGLSPSEKLTLLALANYADQDGKCWPSQVTLTHDTGLSERTIWAAMKRLEDAGLISREKRRRSDGYRTSDLVTIISPATIAVRPDLTRKSCNSHPQILQTSPATIAGHEPSVNHQLEPDEANASSSDVAKPKARGSRIPENWIPDAEQIAFALKEGMTLEELNREADGFRDYWRARPGSGGVKLDWPATWRNWIRRSCDRKRQRGADMAARTAQRPGGGQGVTDFASIVARRQRDGGNPDDVPGERGAIPGSFRVVGSGERA